MKNEEFNKLLEEMSNRKYKLNVPDYIDTLGAVEKIDNKPLYKKNHCNNEERNRQQEELKQCILSLDKEKFFRVFNMECNTGKTYAMIDSIPYYIKKVFFELSMENSMKMQGKKGVLIVLRQIAECEKYSEYLNKLFRNEFSNYDIAISATSNEYQSDNKEIRNKLRGKLLARIPYTPIVFITHEEYCLLAENEDLRKIYTINRRLLIIDESIDICETLEISKKKLEQVNNILTPEDSDTFKKICKPLLNKMTSIEKRKKKDIRNLVYNIKLKDSEIMDLIEYFENKIIPKYSFMESITDYLNKTLKCIKYLYKNTCLITKREVEKGKEKIKEIEITFSTINRDRKMWTLDNNIILDASAKLNPKYEIDKDLYVVMNNPPVLDHSLWNIKNVWISSTKYSKALDIKYKTEKQRNRIKKFYTGCASVINSLGVNDTLVVCNKKEHIIEIKYIDGDIETQRFNPFSKYGCDIPSNNIEHFGNITGKREFANLKNVLIAHTYNYTDTEYILQYMYYKDLHLKDNTEIKQNPIDRLGYVYIFEDMELQEYKEKIIANHMYQAICRVNREMEYSTTVVIASKYLGAMLYVRDMFRVADEEKRHCDFEITNYFNNVFGIFKNGMNEHNKKVQENSLPFHIQNLFEEILKNNIPVDLKYDIADKYIVQVKLSTLYKYFNINKDNKNETKKFSNALYNISDFRRDNAIIEQGKTFNFILVEPIL